MNTKGIDRWKKLVLLEAVVILVLLYDSGQTASDCILVDPIPKNGHMADDEFVDRPMGSNCVSDCPENCPMEFDTFSRDAAPAVENDPAASRTYWPAGRFSVEAPDPLRRGSILEPVMEAQNPVAVALAVETSRVELPFVADPPQDMRQVAEALPDVFVVLWVNLRSLVYERTSDSVDPDSV